MVKDLFKGCFTIPNLLSVIRIALIPVFAVMYLNGNQLLAIAILAVSGLTDLFDGKIARRFNQVSALGKILDTGKSFVENVLSYIISRIKREK